MRKSLLFCLSLWAACHNAHAQNGSAIPFESLQGEVARLASVYFMDWKREQFAPVLRSLSMCLQVMNGEQPRARSLPLLQFIRLVSPAKVKHPLKTSIFSDPLGKRLHLTIKASQSGPRPFLFQIVEPLTRFLALERRSLHDPLEIAQDLPLRDLPFSKCSLSRPRQTDTCP